MANKKPQKKAKKPQPNNKKANTVVELEVPQVVETSFDDVDLMSLATKHTLKKLNTAKKAVKDATEHAPSSASAWFESMTSHTSGNAGSSIDLDNDKLTADEIIGHYMKNTVLLSERTDLFNAELDSKQRAIEASMSKGSEDTNRQARLKRKLLNWNKHELEDEEEGDMLLKAMKDVIVAPSTVKFKSQLKQQHQKKKTVSHDEDQEEDDDEDNEDGDGDMNDAEADLFKLQPDVNTEIPVKYMLQFYENPEDKEAKVKAFLKVYLDNEKHSRVKTQTLVFVKDKKTANQLIPKIGLRVTRHVKNTKGMSNAGLIVNTRGVEILHEGLESWKQERSFNRLRSGKCQTLIVTDGIVSRLWPLRHLVGQIIHYDLPAINALEVLKERQTFMNRPVSRFPSTSTTDAEGNPVDPATLKNIAFIIAGHNNHYRAVARDITAHIEENGQVKIAQALKDLIKEAPIKIRMQ